jgi:hypothetical protein
VVVLARFAANRWSGAFVLRSHTRIATHQIPEPSTFGQSIGSLPFGDVDAVEAGQRRLTGYGFTYRPHPSNLYPAAGAGVGPITAP